MWRSFAVCLIVAVAACRTAETPAALRFETRTYERKEPGVLFRATYPEAVSGPAAAAINSRIAKEMLFGEPVKDLAEAAAKVADGYKKFRAEFPDSAMEHSDERKAELTYQGGHTISLSFTQDAFLGGAHPSSVTSLVNLDARNGDGIPLDSLLVDGALPKLTALVEAALREDHEIPADKKLSQAGFFKDELPLSQNYAIGPKGLTFYYNDYEIGPRVMGPSEILLPYASIQSLLRKDSGFVPPL